VSDMTRRKRNPKRSQYQKAVEANRESLRRKRAREDYYKMVEAKILMLNILQRQASTTRRATDFYLAQRKKTDKNLYKFNF
jgi:hypothetical protein